MGIGSELTSYLETLTVTQGPCAGEPFTVLPWEKRFIYGAFGADGEAALSVGRGNGKSALCAAIACAAIDPSGPLHEPRSEVVLVAASLNQCRIIFEDALAFISAKYDIADRKVWSVANGLNLSHLTHKPSGAKLRAIASDPRRAHGLRPKLLLVDEPAQWQPTQAEAMIAALRTSMGKIENSKLIALGTRSAISGHFFSHMLNDAEYSQVHAATDDDPPGHKRIWRKANPSLPHMPELGKTIAREWKRAKKDPALLASFKALRLNLGVSDVVEALLLDAETWRRIEGKAERSGPCYWGIDLGMTGAMSAIAAYWPDTGRLEAVGAFPRIPDLAARGLRDGVDRLYIEGWKRGELMLSGDHVVTVAELVQEAQRRYGNPSGIAADRYREGELKDGLKAAGLPLTALELRGQGYKDGAADVRAFREECLSDAVTPVPSLVLTSAVGEARTISDPAGNEKLSKSSQGGRRQNARDDAAAASILAVALGKRRRKPKAAAGVYLGLV